MTSVVACVYKHPVKTKHVFQYSFRASYFCLALVSWLLPEKKNNRKEKKKSRQFLGWKKSRGSKNFPKKKGISQKLHLPRSRIHRSRCRSRSRCLPWPAVTQRPLRSLRNSKGMKSCTTLSYVIFVTCFISFPDFSSTFHWFDIVDPYLPQV